MLTVTTARPRGRTRRALLVAALPAALAATAVPAVADAATVEVLGPHLGSAPSFVYRGGAGENNDVRFAQAADGSYIISDSAPLRVTGAAGCLVNAAGDVICGPDVDARRIEAGDGNDLVRFLGDHVFEIHGGDGNDSIFAGVRRGARADTVPMARAPRCCSRASARSSPRWRG